ncbi:MAG: hypothetical protein H5T92_02395 [Synergistales bacterium]|nr:hypothetical protein [Synergistales bacterium]
MREVLIENVGPIEKLAIPLPEAGVVVLRGRNGVGKSHALAAVDSLVSGRGKPPCREGAVRGAVEGFGAKLTIGRSTRRLGEAEVLTLEGRLDISQLVQPPIKDEEAADRQRIKALIQLSGQSADLNAFESILPENVGLGELLPPSELDDDPVVLAGRLKRALEAEARRFEKIAEEHKAELSVVEKELGAAPQCDAELWLRITRQPDVVRAEAEMAVAQALANLRELETRQELAAKQAEQIAQAKRALAELEGGELVSPEKIDAEICELDDKIRKLEQALATARERRAQLVRRREQAAVLQQRIAELRRIVSQEVSIVDDAEIARARDALDAVRRTHAHVTELIRKASLVKQLEHAREQAARAEGRAFVFRDAARAIDEVLSSLVSRVTKRLRVEAGRLVCDTDRGVEAFGELSPGERWRIALEIAVEQLGQGGIVTVPQEAWEALDPINRAEIAEIAKQVGVVILTAEADEHEQIEVEVVR